MHQWTDKRPNRVLNLPPHNAKTANTIHSKAGGMCNIGTENDYCGEAERPYCGAQKHRIPSQTNSSSGGGEARFIHLELTQHTTGFTHRGHPSAAMGRSLTHITAHAPFCCGGRQERDSCTSTNQRRSPTPQRRAPRQNPHEMRSLEAWLPVMSWSPLLQWNTIKELLAPSSPLPRLSEQSTMWLGTRIGGGMGEGEGYQLPVIE